MNDSELPPHTNENLIQASELLTDLTTEWSYPGVLRVEASELTFDFGDAQGEMDSFGYDVSKSADWSHVDSLYENGLPLTSTPEEIAAWIRQVVSKYTSTN